jgi:transcriptional regulator with XRE-family HTH domain
LVSPIGRSRLLEHLKRNGKSQIDLAIHLNVTKSYISQVVAGKVDLSVLNMKKAAKFLNCKMDDLIDWDEDLIE